MHVAKGHGAWILCWLTSVSSLLVIASAKVSKFTICSTKAPEPPITFSR